MAPSNFYLVGTIKQYLSGFQGRNFEELQKNVQRILDTITREEILTTLCEWETRLQRSMTINEEYI
jgi:hypothetical protein